MLIIYLYKNRHALVRICCGQLINTLLSTCTIIIVTTHYYGLAQCRVDHR